MTWIRKPTPGFYTLTSKQITRPARHQMLWLRLWPWPKLCRACGLWAKQLCAYHVPIPGKLFGKGKIAELGDLFKDADVELVLVDGHVSPVQQRNLEKDWGVKILDRTGLILEIFSDRARTREGVLQVEMAALSYQRTPFSTCMDPP